MFFDGTDDQAPSKSVYIRPQWKVLIVDDEPDIIALTRLSLKHFEFENARLTFLEANSFESAVQMLAEHDDIALAIIDIVMDTDDAGLRLVEYIRQDLNNSSLRIMIRTGQPGLAPERYVIDNFDIDDYKNKTELTSQKLYTSVRNAIKAYHQIKVINQHQAGLEKILASTATIFDVSMDNSDYYQNLLDCATELYMLGKDDRMLVDAMVVTRKNGSNVVQCAYGSVSPEGTPDRGENILAEACWTYLCQGMDQSLLPRKALVLPFLSADTILGFLYLESDPMFDDEDDFLMKIFARQCANAITNNRLATELLNK